MRKPNLVQQLLAEPIKWGLETLPRGELIAKLQAEKVPQRLIDAWLMGYDLSQEIRRKAAKKVER